MDELRCRFLGVAVANETVDDDEVAAAAAGSLTGGDGFMGGESNGNGSGWVPF